jgi:hypothetical protein
MNGQTNALIFFRKTSMWKKKIITNVDEFIF